MQVIIIIGVTLVLSVGMILICSFLSGKSKKLIDKLLGNNKDKK